MASIAVMANLSELSTTQTVHCGMCAVGSPPLTYSIYLQFIEKFWATTAENIGTLLYCLLYCGKRRSRKRKMILRLLLRKMLFIFFPILVCFFFTHGTCKSKGDKEWVGEQACSTVLQHILYKRTSEMTQQLSEQAALIMSTRAANIHFGGIGDIRLWAGCMV